MQQGGAALVSHLRHRRLQIACRPPLHAESPPTESAIRRIRIPLSPAFALTLSGRSPTEARP